MKLSLILSTCNQPMSPAKMFLGLALQKNCPDEILTADDGSQDAAPADQGS